MWNKMPQTETQRSKKSKQLRNKIRIRQIQQYKSKMRERFSAYLNETNWQDHNTDKRKLKPNHMEHQINFTTQNRIQSDPRSIVFTKIYQNADQQLRKVQHNLQLYFSILGSCQSHQNSSSLNNDYNIGEDAEKANIVKQTIEKIRKQYDILINMLIKVEQQHKRQKINRDLFKIFTNILITINKSMAHPYLSHQERQQQHPRKSNIHYNQGDRPTQVHDKQSISAIDIEQRCLISFYYNMYTSLVIENLSKINEGATGHKGYIGEYMKYIEMVINYVGWRIYEQNQLSRHAKYSQTKAKYEDRYSFGHRQCKQQRIQILDFTQTQELILQKLVVCLDQIMCMFTEINLPQFSLMQQIQTIVDKLLLTYSTYLKLYEHQIIYDMMPSTPVDDVNLGNMCFQSIKSLLKISIQCVDMFTRAQLQPHSQIDVNIHRSILASSWHTVNHIAQLLNRVCVYVQGMPAQSIKQVENTTSNGMHETLVGLVFRLCDYVIYVFTSANQQVSTMLQDLSTSHNTTHRRRPNSKGNLQQLCKQWLSRINNKDIIASIGALLNKKCYRQDYIRQLYNQSFVEIYLMSCIFSTKQEQGSDQCADVETDAWEQCTCQYLRQAKKAGRYGHKQTTNSYCSFRSKKWRIQQKMNTQLQCLKTIYEFIAYGIDVDEQNNLSLRYLTLVGNGSINQYYFSKIGTNKSHGKIVSKEF